MARTNQAYPPEFRQQMVELVKSGRTPNELAREYEPSAGSIRNWVAQDERDGGQRSDGLSTDERLELRRLQRENKQLRTERDILKRAAAWFARESDSIPNRDSGAPFSAGIPVTGRLRGQPGGGGSMSAPTLAIRASHAARRRHSASIRDLRADRHPNEPHSGPLRPFRAVGGTLGYPLDRPSMALGRGGPACISPAAGLQRPVINAVSAARRWSAPCTIRLTYRLCRQDCSLCDGVTNRRSYLSTKPGQLHHTGPSARFLQGGWGMPRLGVRTPRANLRSRRSGNWPPRSAACVSHSGLSILSMCPLILMSPGSHPDCRATVVRSRRWVASSFWRSRMLFGAPVEEFNPSFGNLCVIRESPHWIRRPYRGHIYPGPHSRSMGNG